MVEASFTTFRGKTRQAAGGTAVCVCVCVCVCVRGGGWFEVLTTAGKPKCLEENGPGGKAQIIRRSLIIWDTLGHLKDLWFYSKLN